MVSYYFSRTFIFLTFWTALTDLCNHPIILKKKYLFKLAIYDPSERLTANGHCDAWVQEQNQFYGRIMSSMKRTKLCSMHITNFTNLFGGLFYNSHQTNSGFPAAKNKFHHRYHISKYRKLMEKRNESHNIYSLNIILMDFLPSFVKFYFF